jgi:predicted trehalose synthase
MKSIQDEWGHDPSVRSMRRVFSFMEEAQHGLLSRLNISPFDKRLRSIREKALELFEQAWSLAIGQRIFSSEEDAAPLYIYCLARALSSAGVEVPEELLPGDEKIIHFLKEKLP